VRRVGRRTVGWLHRALILAGAAGFALLVAKSGTGALVRDLATLGAGVALVVAMAIFEHTLHAVAWRRCFVPAHRPSSARLLGAHLAGFTVNLVTPTATIGGEVVRAGLLPRTIPATEVAASVTSDRLAMAVADTAIGIVGFVALVAWGPFGAPVRVALGAAAALFVAGVATFFTLQRAGRLAAFFGERSLLRKALGTERADRVAKASQEIDARLAALHADRPGDFRAALALHALGTSVGAVQLAVFLWWLGVPFTVLAVCVAFAVAVALDLFSFFVPARLGAQEAARMLAMTVAGLDPARGLSFSLVLRAEQIFWAGIGLLVVPSLLGARREPPVPLAARAPDREHPGRAAEAPLEEGGEAC
jgi:glycosyltransferase 2 family protein